MNRGSELETGPQSVGLVWNSLWGASGGWQDVSVLDLEELLLQEVLLV